MNFTLLSSIFTVFSLLVFLGILYWAYSKENRASFEAMAQMPFADEDGELSNPELLIQTKPAQVALIDKKGK